MLNSEIVATLWPIPEIVGYDLKPWGGPFCVVLHVVLCFNISDSWRAHFHARQRRESQGEHLSTHCKGERVDYHFEVSSPSSSQVEVRNSLRPILLGWGLCCCGRCYSQSLFPPGVVRLMDDAREYLYL